MRLKRKRKLLFTLPTFIHIIEYKKVPIFAESAISQLWSAIFCATGAWGGKAIGRVRVEPLSNPRTSRLRLQAVETFWPDSLLKVRLFLPLMTFGYFQWPCLICVRHQWLIGSLSNELYLMLYGQFLKKRRLDLLRVGGFLKKW